MHLFFSVGEPSGDQHAAHLIHELRLRRPDVQVSGFGGPLMEQAGCRLEYRLTDLAVMGLLRVLPLLWRFWTLVRQARRLFAESRPDAVVLVDFPGFNWWIARAAKKAGIPVFYFLPPQLWAWGPWRVRRMRKYVDHILCGLPFEPEWYARRGLQAEYVGHPFFDDVAGAALDRTFCDEWSPPPSSPQRNVGILPGSRNQEIARNWPLIVRVMQGLSARHPHARFLVACYKEEHRRRCTEFLRSAGVDLPVHFFVGRTPEIIELADCCLMVSGSVSLEMLARRTPAAVLYSVGGIRLLVLRPFLRVDSITLPNLIARRRILPEWLIGWFPGRAVAGLTRELDGWLSDRSRLERVRDELTALHREAVRPGATARTAEIILERLGAAAVATAA